MIKDLPLSDVDTNALEVLEAFTREKVAPLAAQADRESQLPNGLIDELDRLGLFGPNEEAPAPGIQLVLLERLACGDAGLAYQIAGEVAARRLMEAAGIEAPGGTRYAFAYYEGYGRSPLELRTEATAAGRHRALTGVKRAVILPAATSGLVLIANVDGVPAALFLGPAGFDDVMLERDDHVVGRLGVRSAATGDLSFDGVTVPADALIGTAGSAILHSTVAWFRLAVGSIAVGVASASTRYATEYAKVRASFGREIINYQGVEFPLVDSDMAQDAARLEILAAWSEIEAGVDPERAADRARYAYGVAVAAGISSTLVGVNTLGGHGYLTDHPVERWYRDATALAAFDFDPLAHSGSLF